MKRTISDLNNDIKEIVTKVNDPLTSNAETAKLVASLM